MMRTIPRVMFSQHPDHASIPYWHDQALIRTLDELTECYHMFSEFGAEEMMWDWEGKWVDESVVERLLSSHPEFFKTRPLGKELFLTFRVPNPSIESGYRLGRAFMAMLSAQHLAQEHHMASPLFEVILPMAERASEMIQLQQFFMNLATASQASFASNNVQAQPIEIIPTFERVQTLLDSRHILKEYVALYQATYHQTPTYLRPFCARSDPALNSGIVPTTFAIKWALSEYQKFSRDSGIPTFPILAPGSLPFRGGLTPETALAFLNEFQGIRTLVIQSAFRYDYPKNQATNAIRDICNQIKNAGAPEISDAVRTEIDQMIPWFEHPYRERVEQLAPLIQQIAPSIPKRRERVQHIGLFGYSRDVSGVQLPRAIGFAASCYSLGIPPELLGTGYGLKMTHQQGKLEVIESLYRNLRSDLERAGKFFRRESLEELGLGGFKEDIDAIEKYLGHPLGPETPEQHEHTDCVAEIITSMKNGTSLQDAILRTAVLRKAIG